MEGHCDRPGPAARKSNSRMFPKEEPTSSAFEMDLDYVCALCARGFEDSPLREDAARKKPQTWGRCSPERVTDPYTSLRTKPE